MGWMICVAALAAFGLMSLAVLFALWCLPGDGEELVFCEGRPGIQENGGLRRHLVLREMGLTGRRMVVTDLGLSGAERRWLERLGAEIWTREAYLIYLETERNRIDGTGNGDYSGRHQRRGV